MTSSEQTIFKELMDKYLTDTISGADKEQLLLLIRQPAYEPLLNEYLQAGFDASKDLQLSPEWETDFDTKLKNKIAAQPAKSRPLYYFTRWVAAAVLLFAIAGTTYFILTKKTITNLPIAKQTDVAPGHKGALLTLANGTRIMLDTAKDGIISSQNGLTIIKQNGEIRYEGTTAETAFNTASTDRGRQYQITLSDGTKVWLNAESSIHYPLVFNGKERIVEVTGEAYFEVVHNVKQPFKVKVGNQIIEDIGTSFNVNAYKDELSINTTLLEGAVKVNVKNTSQLLSPGQQAQVNASTETIRLVKDANVEQAVAWKNGTFFFTDASLPTVMRQLTRWYNVDVKYVGAMPNKQFSGELGQTLTLNQVLRILTKNKVKYTIEGSQITIMP